MGKIRINIFLFENLIFQTDVVDLNTGSQSTPMTRTVPKKTKGEPFVPKRAFLVLFSPEISITVCFDIKCYFYAPKEAGLSLGIHIIQNRLCFFLSM